jgi:hypothetical protein
MATKLMHIKPLYAIRMLKNNKTRQFGEYPTQRLVLEPWDCLFGS